MNSDYVIDVDSFQQGIERGRKRRVGYNQERLYSLLHRLELVPSFSTNKDSNKSKEHKLMENGTIDKNDLSSSSFSSSSSQCYHTRTSKTMKDYDVNGNFLRYRMTDLYLNNQNISSDEIKLLCQVFLFPKDHKEKYHFPIDKSIEETIPYLLQEDHLSSSSSNIDIQTTTTTTTTTTDNNNVINNGINLSPALLLSLAKWSNQSILENFSSSLASTLSLRATSSLDFLNFHNQPQQLQLSLSTSLTRFLKMNINLHTLHLGGNRLGDEGTVLLIDALTFHPSLHTLDLGFNDIGDMGAEALKQLLLPHHPVSLSLQTLYLSGNKIGPFGGLALAQGIQYNNTLETLHLSGNSIGEAAVPLGEALITNGGLKTLYLAGNKVGSQWGPLFLSSLSKNQHLECLYLMDNNIKDHGMYALAKAIETKKNFRVLQLSFNQITQVGIGFLASAFSAHFFGNQNQVSTIANRGHIVLKKKDDNSNNCYYQNNKNKSSNLNMNMDIETKTSFISTSDHQMDRSQTPNMVFTNMNTYIGNNTSLSSRPQDASTDTLSMSAVGNIDMEGSNENYNHQNFQHHQQQKQHLHHQQQQNDYFYTEKERNNSNNSNKSSMVFSQENFGYPSLEELYLDNNELEDEGLECLASQALPYLGSLHTLNIGYNGIRSALGVKALSNYLNLPPSSSFSLTDQLENKSSSFSLIDQLENKGDDGDHIGGIGGGGYHNIYNNMKLSSTYHKEKLVCNLKRLFLCGIKFDLQACKYLGHILSKNKSLEEIVIDSSGYGVSGGGGLSVSNHKTVDVMDQDLLPTVSTPNSSSTEKYPTKDFKPSASSSSSSSSTSTSILSSDNNHSIDTNKRGRRYDQMRNESVRKNNFGDKGESYIARGILQNSQTRLRKFTGFQLAPVFKRITRDYFIAIKTQEMNNHMNLDPTNKKYSGPMEHYMKNPMSQISEEMSPEKQAYFHTLMKQLIFPFPYIYSEEYRNLKRHSSEAPQLACNITLEMDIYSLKNELALRIVRDHHFSLNQKNNNKKSRKNTISKEHNNINNSNSILTKDIFTPNKHEMCFHTPKTSITSPRGTLIKNEKNPHKEYLRQKIDIGRVKLGRNCRNNPMVQQDSSPLHLLQNVDKTTNITADFEYSEGSFSTNITPIVPYQNIPVTICTEDTGGPNNQLNTKQEDKLDCTEYSPYRRGSSRKESPNTPAYGYDYNNTNFQKSPPLKYRGGGVYNELECKNEFTN